MSINEENWMIHFHDLQAYVQEHGHFPPKHTLLNNWVRYQRKRIKQGIMPNVQYEMFRELCSQRSTAHTGGRRKKNVRND